jgi:hypothetical protein
MEHYRQYKVASVQHLFTFEGITKVYVVDVDGSEESFNVSQSELNVWLFERITRLEQRLDEAGL